MMYRKQKFHPRHHIHSLHLCRFPNDTAGFAQAPVASGASYPTIMLYLRKTSSVKTSWAVKCSWKQVDYVSKEEVTKFNVKTAWKVCALGFLGLRCLKRVMDQAVSLNYSSLLCHFRWKTPSRVLLFQRSEIFSLPRFILFQFFNLDIRNCSNIGWESGLITWKSSKPSSRCLLHAQRPACRPRTVALAALYFITKLSACISVEEWI